MPNGNDPHHFDFDLDRGIRAQVVEKLETSPLLPLTKGAGPQASGIYALYFKNRLVYVGKASKGTTKSKRTLCRRLAEHVAKISGRRNVALDDMRCRYLTAASEAIDRFQFQAMRLKQSDVRKCFVGALHNREHREATLYDPRLC